MNAKNRENPLTLSYMSYMRLMLLTVGAWPGDAVHGRARRVPYFAIYLMVEAVGLIVGETLFIFNRFHEASFFVLGSVYVTLSLSYLVLFRAVIACFDKYGIIFKEFITKFHLIHFKHKSEFSEQMFQTTNKVSHYFTVFMISLSLTGVISFNAMPFFQNYSRGVFRHPRPENITTEFSIHYLFPGFEQEDHIIFSSVANLIFSYICAFIICTMDLALCLMVFQIIGHIHTLIHTLRNFPKPKKMKDLQGYRQRNGESQIYVEIVQHFNDEENETIRKIIIDCIEHHLLINDFTNEISNFFGPMLAFNYMYHLVCLSLLLVECMEGEDTLMRYGPLTLMTLTQLAQLSITFEVVGSESEKLKNEVYYVPWESMSVSNQKSMAFLLQRVQTPVRVTAMGMTPVGVMTMGAILKTTLSYCAFLRSLG